MNREVRRGAQGRFCVWRSYNVMGQDDEAGGRGRRKGQEEGEGYEGKKLKGVN